ncbi:hypothetical protein [Hydrogenophaga crocea]|uniref:Uncharacterized protein n=1 Tax=Hydrogenophaga crocea TaxID=2716225 RepID=A0A6G8IC33_9BURK|nr:hypothetical protein [Hydrogenophaga crocea]QIM50737.1 hypothetical protein G9Q37_00620 [Hydrogenophaga crocea]
MTTLVASAQTKAPSPFKAEAPVMPSSLSFRTGDSFERAFARYLISCALGPDTRVVVPPSRPGEATDVFPGEMGLANEWAHQALQPEAQRLVSACLLARTNHFGVPVLLSLRQPQAAPGTSLHADERERASFSRLEGKFFGNLFTTPPRAYYCRGDDRPDRWVWLTGLKRVCTPALLPGESSLCGLQDVGLCSGASLVQEGIDYGPSAIDVYLPDRPSDSPQEIRPSS